MRVSALIVTQKTFLGAVAIGPRLWFFRVFDPQHAILGSTSLFAKRFRK